VFYKNAIGEHPNTYFLIPATGNNNMMDKQIPETVDRHVFAINEVCSMGQNIQYAQNVRALHLNASYQFCFVICYIKAWGSVVVKALRY
jgi:hypothetical protein